MKLGVADKVSKGLHTVLWYCYLSIGGSIQQPPKVWWPALRFRFRFIVLVAWKLKIKKLSKQ